MPWRQHRAIPVTLTSRVRDHVSSDVLVGPSSSAGETPALLYSTCSPPKVSTANGDGGGDALVVGDVSGHEGGLTAGVDDGRHDLGAVGDVGNDDRGSLARRTARRRHVRGRPPRP